MAYWWDAQSDSLVNKGEVEFLNTIGADALIRGHYPMYGRQWDDMALFKLKYKNTKVYEFNKRNERIKTYETPVGKLDFIYRYSSSGNTWFLSKHPVKSEEDYKILTYIYEDARSILPQNISLIGGIEPTVFLNSTMDELESYVDKLLTKMKGTRYILANSDSCPPGVELKKFKLMNELVNRFR